MPGHAAKPVSLDIFLLTSMTVSVHLTFILRLSSVQNVAVSQQSVSVVIGLDPTVITLGGFFTL